LKGCQRNILRRYHQVPLVKLRYNRHPEILLKTIQQFFRPLWYPQQKRNAAWNWWQTSLCPVSLDPLPICRDVREPLSDHPRMTVAIGFVGCYFGWFLAAALELGSAPLYCN
jgi:hypothetical protein